MSSVGIILMQSLKGGFISDDTKKQQESECQERKLRESIASRVKCPRCGGVVEHDNYKKDKNIFVCWNCEGKFYHSFEE